jgi:hypothetical protein
VLAVQRGLVLILKRRSAIPKSTDPLSSDPRLLCGDAARMMFRGPTIDLCLNRLSLSLHSFPEKPPMPNYNAQNPPYSIFPGDVALAFNSESPATGQASQQFALPSYAGYPENGRTIRWQVSYATAPTAVTIQLQTAMNDVDAQYAIPTGAANMTTSLTAGDNLVASGVRANFVRAKVTSITGGSGVTVQILG